MLLSHLDNVSQFQLSYFILKNIISTLIMINLNKFLIINQFIMKNNYKRNSNRKVLSENQVHEQPSLSKSRKLESHKQLLDSLPLKIQIIQEFYKTKVDQQRKKILMEWPNQIIKKYLNDNDIIQIKNQSFFVGQISNNMLHGYGLFIYSSQKFYQGAFNNNMKHGEGMEYITNGAYIGNYVNNKPEGKGIFIWNNDQIYEGEFLAGMKHGHGKWVANNQSYSGQWRANKPDGVGVIVTQQSTYEGDIRLGLKHGQGKQFFKNGDKYIGSYINGRPEGFGQYIWNRNSSNFRGNFKNGLRHGKGIWVQDGNRYEGNYINDKKNGMGTFHWASGNRYHGNYFDDLRHGYGQMNWNDGSWYKGEWKYGAQHGLGEMYEMGNHIRRGVFDNNIFVLEQDIKRNIPKSIQRRKNILKKSRVQFPPNIRLHTEQNKPKYSKSNLDNHNQDTQKKLSRLNYRKKTEPAAIFNKSVMNQLAENSTDIEKSKKSSKKKIHFFKQKPILLLPDLSSQVIQWANLTNIQTPMISTSTKYYNKSNSSFNYNSDHY